MKNKTYRKLVTRIALIVVLIIMMAVTSYAYIASVLRVNDNTFATGLVDINLNNGQSIVEGIDLIEPGATYIKEFFLENRSSDLGGVWYKIYFENVAGELADILIVTLQEKGSDEILATGTMNEISKENIDAFEDVLGYGETKYFTITFHYPEEAGNEGMGTQLIFSLAADATQTKNNPDKLFE